MAELLDDDIDILLSKASGLICTVSSAISDDNPARVNSEDAIWSLIVADTIVKKAQGAYIEEWKAKRKKSA